MKSNAVVYICDASLLEDMELYNFIYSSVSEARRSKTDRLAFNKDRNLSLSAEYLLMCACRDFDLSYKDLRVGYGENSKPYLINSPLCFNLSHSEKRAMCVMSDVPCGCDVEFIKPFNPRIAERFFSFSEKQTVASGNTEREREELFYRIWTLKESFIKCTGTGLNTALDSFSVQPGNPYAKICQSGFDGEFTLKEFVPEDGYRYSCCVKAAEGSCGFEFKFKKIGYNF